MNKRNINFKQIRKKVIQNQNDENSENIPINPTNKVSFRGIKRHQQICPIQLSDSVKKGAYLSPIKINTTRNKVVDSKEDCNKFSVLLESKGYANSNCNSGRKKSTDISFRTLANMNNSSKTKLNTERNQVEYRLKTLNTERTKAEYRLNTERNQESTKAEMIQEKCRQIKQKQYFSSRAAPGELNSLNKLKNKLISPLKKNREAPPAPVPTRQEKVINIFQHSSILSQHDLVNTSKTNQSIDFDMSPWL